MEVLKTQPFTVHLSPFPEIDCPKAILGLRFWILDLAGQWEGRFGILDLGSWIQNQKPKTQNPNPDPTSAMDFECR